MNDNNYLTHFNTKKIFPTREETYQEITGALNSMRKDPLISKNLIEELEELRKWFEPLGFKERLQNWWNDKRRGKLEILRPKSLEVEDIAETILKLLNTRSRTMLGFHLVMGIDAPVHSLIKGVNYLQETNRIKIVQEEDGPLNEENFRNLKIKIIS